MTFSPTDSTSTERRHIFADDDLAITETLPPVRMPRTRSALRVTSW